MTPDIKFCLESAGVIPTWFLHLALFIISVPLSCFLNTSNIYLFIKLGLGTINSHLSGFYIYSIALILPNSGHSQMLNHWTMSVLQQWVRLACRKEIILITYLALPQQGSVSLYIPFASPPERAVLRMDEGLRFWLLEHSLSVFLSACCPKQFVTTDLRFFKNQKK